MPFDFGPSRSSIGAILTLIHKAVVYSRAATAPDCSVQPFCRQGLVILETSYLQKTDDATNRDSGITLDD